MTEEQDGSPHLNHGLRDILLAHPGWVERYHGWEEIGRGSFATVVKTFSKHVGDDVAVKIFHRLDGADQRRFQQEVQSAQRLDSPTAVRMYSPFWGTPPWIEMEYVDGPNLREELEARAAAKRPFALVEALDLGIAVAEALHEAHRRRIVHRDVKPANILLPRSRSPLAKLADFGIARFEGADRLTATGVFAGTPQFGSPEAFVGDEPVGEPHDIYGLGLCLYLVLSGNRFPWRIKAGADLRYFMGLHISVAPSSVRPLCPEADSQLDTLLLRCLAKEPRKRPAAGDVVDALIAIRSRADRRGAGFALTPPPHSDRQPARLPLALLAGAALGVVAWAGVPSLRETLVGAGTATPVAPAPVIRPVATRPVVPPRPVEDVPAAIRRIQMLPAAIAVHTGEGPLASVKVTIRTAAGTVHRTAINGMVNAGEEVYALLDSFKPAIRRNASFAAVEVDAFSASGKVHARWSPEADDGPRAQPLRVRAR